MAGRGPGTFGSVWQGGHLLYEGSLGVADLEEPRQITRDDHLRIGSLTKIYVAALTLQLRDDGLLALDDPVHRWLPDMVPVEPARTIAVLLRMRSGIADYVPALLGAEPDLAVFEREYQPRTLATLGVATTPPRPPGVFAYSNTDYVLLGLIVERASGQLLPELLAQRIFEPLALHHTSFPTQERTLPSPHARGYVRVAKGSPYVDATCVTPSESWASGALVSTPGDVATFLSALLDHDFLPPATLTLMLSTGDKGADADAYCMGISRHRSSDGAVAYGHRGGTPGFNTVVLHDRARQRTVLLYENCLHLTAPLALEAPFLLTALS